MPSTLKCMIATVFYLCTLTTSTQIPHDRFQQLDAGYRNLRDNLVHHETHVTGPFTKALLDQMRAVKNQVSDLSIDMGCVEQKQMDDICYVLFLEEARLVYDILTKGVEWYVDAERKAVKKETLFE